MEIKILKKYPLIKHILLMLGVLFGLIIITFFLLRIYTRHGKEYVLPNLIGKSVDETTQMKEMNRFQLVLIDSLYMNNKPGGIILAMDPYPDAKVKSGRKIYVTITSYQPEDVEMPDLVDLTIRQAISLLESYNLECGELTFTQDIAKNAVLKQMHKGQIIFPRKKVARHSAIDLLIGSGVDSSAIPLTKAPLIIGKTPREARRALHIVSLNVGNEHFAKGVTEENARVIKQSPDYNSWNTMSLGTPVEIWYVEEGKTDFDKIIRDYSNKRTDTMSVEEEQQEGEHNW